MIGSGICWTLTFLLILRRGVLDMTYGMPLAALCANLAWETIYSFVLPHTMPQLVVDRVWFAFDVLILLQYIRFGPIVKRVTFPFIFYLELLLGLIIAFTAILSLGVALKDIYGAYAAFGQNLMMSILFITLLRDRKTVNGQSIYIAIFKMLGTLMASVAFYTQTKTYSHSLLMQFLFVAIFVYDVIYIVVLHNKLKLHHIRPFRRW